MVRWMGYKRCVTCLSVQNHGFYSQRKKWISIRLTQLDFSKHLSLIFFKESRCIQTISTSHLEIWSKTQKTNVIALSISKTLIKAQLNSLRICKILQHNTILSFNHIIYCIEKPLDVAGYNLQETSSRVSTQQESQLKVIFSRDSTLN